MAERTERSGPIKKPGIVVAVEGAGEWHVVAALRDRLDLTDRLQPWELGGNKKLPAKLHALASNDDFRENARAVGLVIDAEDREFRDAWASVCGAMKRGFGVEEMPPPGTVGAHEGRLGRVGAFVLPDNGSSGMLEDLCLSAIAAQKHVAAKCVDAFVECLQDTEVRRPDWPKRRMQAFLAAQDKPGLLLGQAAQAGYFDFDDECWHPLKQFLRALAADE